VNYIYSQIKHEPEKALRFSWTSNFDWGLQMLIPREVVNLDELDLWSECFSSMDELEDEHGDKTINYESWTITGKRGPESLQTFVPWIDVVDPMDPS
jgi:hypothetical protein